MTPDFEGALQGALGPSGARMLLEAIGDAPDVAVVGGWVRDTLLGQPSVDVDLAAGRPAALVARFQAAGSRKTICLDPERGVWRIVVGGGRFVDVCALKGDTLEADLRARDLTINAIAWVPGRGLIDPLGGAQDLANRTLRLAYPEALSDDPLRALRVVRFATRLGFLPSPPLLAELRKADLGGVSAERVQAELAGILRAGARLGVELLEAADLLGTLPRCNPARLAEAEALDWSTASMRRLRRQIRQENGGELGLTLGFLLDGPLELVELAERRWPRRIATRALLVANTPFEDGEHADAVTDQDRARRLVRWGDGAAFGLACHAVRGGEAAVAPYLALLDETPGHRNPGDLPVPPLPRPLVAAGKIQRWLGSGPQVSAALEELLVAQLTGEIADRDDARAWLEGL